MQNSSAFQYLSLATIHESTTNPRHTFDEAKLYELAESIRHNGLIQPITVRPNGEGFEIIAGARRYRAAQIAELAEVPARIVEVSDTQALEWQLVENSQRVDVHPFEEAQGFQRLLDMPGYDVATLTEKSGKSASHVYARLSLLQLIPEVADAFTQERISTSHANLIARLPQHAQAEAFEQCWRKDWQDKEAHLLPAKYLAGWIATNLYLPLAEAPFDREDTTLNPAAGACVTCPRRSGFNTSLFCDVQGDQCLDSTCYHSKIEAHIEREVAAHPELVQIETAWRGPKEQRPGALVRGHFRELPNAEPENPDADPTASCSSTRSAIIVYGKGTGSTITVCTDPECPAHDPRAAARTSKQTRQTAAPRTTAPQSSEAEETEEQAQERQRQRLQAEEEQEAKAEERRQEFERQQQEYEAAQTRRAELQKKREAMFEKIIANSPATFTAAQLRVLLRALVNIDFYTFTDDIAEELSAENETDNRSAEEILLSAVDATPDERLTAFALRLALSGHRAIPREGEPDFLAEAENVFAPPKAKKPASKANKQAPTLVKPPSQKTASKRKKAA